MFSGSPWVGQHESLSILLHKLFPRHFKTTQARRSTRYVGWGYLQQILCWKNGQPNIEELSKCFSSDCKKLLANGINCIRLILVHAIQKVQTVTTNYMNIMDLVRYQQKRIKYLSRNGIIHISAQLLEHRCCPYELEHGVKHHIFPHNSTQRRQYSI